MGIQELHTEVWWGNLSKTVMWMKDEDNIKLDLSRQSVRMRGGYGLKTVKWWGFGVRGVELSCSANTMLCEIILVLNVRLPGCGIRQSQCL
jgi:hypothetical protein